MLDRKHVIKGLITGYFILLLSAFFIFGITYGTLFLLGIGIAVFLFFWMQSQPQTLKIKRLKMGYLILLGLFFSSLLLVELLVMSRWNSKPPEGQPFDYIIVLGAGLKKDTVSIRLQKRLDKALEYAREYKSVPVIVSGGQGSDEQISEAEAMQRYLINQNLAPNRIIQESESTSTYENLKFSQRLLSVPNAKVLIVTSDYHLFRALFIGRRLGYDCYGAAATSRLGIRLNYSLREYITVIKDALLVKTTPRQS